jgi:hypothetical protein
MTTPEPQPVPNKRKSQRRSPKNSTKVICYCNTLCLGPNLAQNLLDLSESGAGLLMNKELKVGQHIALEFDSPSRRNIVVNASVVWIAPAEKGQFRAGLKFEKSLPWAALLELAH